MNDYPPLKFTLTDGPCAGRDYSFPKPPEGAKQIPGGVYVDVPNILKKGMIISRVDLVAGQRVSSGGKYKLEYDAESGTYKATHIPTGIDKWPNLVATAVPDPEPKPTPTIINPEKKQPAETPAEQ